MPHLEGQLIDNVGRSTEENQVCPLSEQLKYILVHWKEGLTTIGRLHLL